ncbi:MAG: hypothetical protein D6725_04330 [Planctomycetota bacterium]|nr:MAG: hypothetical protein D6725_04330 [Planctomycetota bacterium]
MNGRMRGVSRDDRPVQCLLRCAERYPDGKRRRTGGFGLMRRLPERRGRSIRIRECSTRSSLRCIAALRASSEERAMGKSKLTVAAPLVLIGVGAGWLLTELEVVPHVDWVWIVALALSGVLIFVLSGFHKLSFVGGGFFLLAAAFSFARQQGMISLRIELPTLLIGTGVLMLLARILPIPEPPWLEDRRLAGEEP